LIGHLQRNKVGRVVRDFEVVQSIDRAEIAVALARRCEAEARHLSVFIEVKLGDEPTKHGASPDELAELAAAIRSLEPLSLQGLMAIPPGGTAEEARPYFRRLRVAAEDLGLRGLSMGMTDDFETAIEEGATIVRVGRAIFGDRR
jgi:pyridoxal phosphate enzyme (YggS family)